MTPFLNGAAQFFIPSHLFVVVALGLLAGQHRRRFPLLMLAAFALGLTLGSLAVASAIRENPLALGLLVLAVSAAGLVVLACELPRWLPGLMALVGGAVLPLGAPPHELTIMAAIASQAGLAVTAILVFAATSLIAACARDHWQRIAVRIVASWITASVILVLALRLVR